MTCRDELEVPLVGGSVTVGLVRVGDTVRRPPTERSPYVARVLRALERVGFDGAPRYLGTDARGRDVLSFVEGAVHPRWARFADEQVAAAARLLRRFHDALAGSDLAEGHEVVCHRDPGSQNMVFDAADLPCALIDMDGLEPGSRLEDVGYLALSWCTWSSTHGGPEADAAAQARQLRVLADAYGLDGAGRAGLVDAIAERQRWSIAFWAARPGDPTAADHVASCRHELARTGALAAVFGAALT